MRITFLGHSSFRIEIERAVFLIDPWLHQNPAFPKAQTEAAIEGVTHILLTHGHSDHIGDAMAIAAQKSVPIVGIVELVAWCQEHGGVDGLGFNKGGTVGLNGAKVTMVAASHSSSITHEGARLTAGAEVGFMIAGEGHTIYVSGDTDIMADMEWMGDVHNPDIGILSAGGHYTMDMKRAAYAAKRYFNFKTVIPCHYKTFSVLEQSAKVRIRALPDVQVIEPEVMVPISFV